MNICYAKELELILNTRLGQSVAGVHFCPRGIFDLGESALLDSIEVNPCSQIFYSVKDIGYGPNGILSGSNGRAFRGATISARQDNAVVHHVFIQNDRPGSQFSNDETRLEDLAINQILALTHELGHVQDMNAQKNFSYEPAPAVWLARAEAEAHAFCLEYLSDRGLVELRNLLAQNLSRLSGASSGFEKSLYAALCDRIGKGRLKRWAA